MSNPNLATVGSQPARCSSETRVDRVPVDRARIQSVVENHFDFVWRILRRLGVPGSGADDAAQKVFLVAADKIGDVSPERERSYLFAVALRVAASDRRARKRRPEVCESENDWDAVPDSTPSPDELIDQARARTLLDRILEGLPFEQRTVFVLYEMEQLTTLEIAELLEIPHGTVASRLRRARELYFQAVNRAKAHLNPAGLP